jgi:hypothetical protein
MELATIKMHGMNNIEFLKYCIVLEPVKTQLPKAATVAAKHGGNSWSAIYTYCLYHYMKLTLIKV